MSDKRAALRPVPCCPQLDQRTDGDEVQDALLEVGSRARRRGLQQCRQACVSWVRSMQAVTGCSTWCGCDQAGTGRREEEAGAVKFKPVAW